MYSLLLPTQSTTVISRQLSNIPTHGLLSKCKNNSILLTDQSKSPKKTIKALSWNYSIITPLKYNVFENIMENGAFDASGANAPFSIIFSKVFKTLLKFVLIFFQCYLKKLCHDLK